MSSAASSKTLSPSDLDLRLAALGVPIASFIAAAQIRRATWGHWCAGRTRPRPDKWAAAIAAFDALAAEAKPPMPAPALVESEAASSEPVTLVGSSPPTGAPPSFAPIATAEPPVEDCHAAMASSSGGDLDELIAAHPAALTAEAEAVAVAKAAEARFDEAAARRPAVLFWRVDDPFHNPRGRERSPSGGWYQFYTEADIDELREEPEPCHFSSGSVDSPEGPGMAWRPDPRRIARKAAILAAYDDWQAARAAVAERVGVTAACTERNAAAAAVRRLEDTILETAARTLAEIVIKARWIEAQDKVEAWADFVLYDVLNLAEDVDQVVPLRADAAEVPIARAAA